MQAYHRKTELGKGGMSIVHRAEQASLGRDVAVKVIRPDKVTNQDFIDLLKMEAKVLAEVDHPNNVPVYDLSEDDQGNLFYSMKEIKGTPWSEVIESKSLEENLDILLNVADAIALAHSKEIYHLDLKPVNIMLGEFGEVYVTDWGIAKSKWSPQEDRESGTPQYAAPEMAQGIYEEIGAHSDVYLMGAMLYEIIGGKPPHTGAGATGFINAALNKIEPIDYVGELKDIALTAMATAPEDRYPSIRAFQEAVRQFLSHSASLKLSERAEEELKTASETGDYSDFAKSVFGFEEAYELWNGNSEAASGISYARLAYARAALEKHDYDLGLSLVDEDDELHKDVHSQLVEAQHERNTRQKRLKLFRRTAVGMLAALVIVATVAYFWVDAERKAAIDARDAAVKAQLAEAVAKQEAVEARDEAIEARDAAVKAEKAEAVAKQQAVVARDEAIDAKNEAERSAFRTSVSAYLAQVSERRAKSEAERAIRANRLAQQQAYLALIGAAAARIDENAFVEAASLLRNAKRIDEDAPDNSLAKAIEGQLREGAKPLLEEAQERFGEDFYQDIESQISAAAAAIAESGAGGAGGHLRNWEWGRLWHLCNQSLQTLQLHTPLDAVAFVDGGKQFITGGWDGKVRFFDTDAQPGLDPKPTRAPLTVNGHIFAFDVLVAGGHEYLAVGSSDYNGYIRIWRRKLGAATYEAFAGTAGAAPFQGHTNTVVSLAFSQDGKMLLSGSQDGTARLWDVQTGRQLQVLRAHEGTVWDVAFSPPDVTDKLQKYLVTAGNDGIAYIWEDETGRWTQDVSYYFKNRVPLGSHWGAIYAADFSSDGRFVATAGEDRRILVWNLFELDAKNPTERLQPSVRRSLTVGQTLRGHVAPVRSVAFLPQNSLLLSCGDDNTIRIWNVESEGLVKSLEGNATSTTQMLATEDRQVAIQMLRGHSGFVRSCDYDANRQLLLSGSHDTTAKVWRLAVHGDANVFGARIYHGHQGPILAAAFAPDAEYFVTAGLDRKAKVHMQAWTGSHPLADDDDEPQGETPPRQSDELSEGHEFLIRKAVFAPDGTKLLTSSIDNTVRIWNAQQGTELASLKGTGRAGALAISNSGKWVASGSDKTIPAAEQPAGGKPPVRLIGDAGDTTWGLKIWDLAKPDGPKAVFATLGEVTAIDFSNNDELVFIGDSNGRCMLWDLKANALKWGRGASQKRHQRAIFAAFFLNGDREILAASRDGSISRWDVASGEELPAKSLFVEVPATSQRPSINAIAVSHQPGSGQFAAAAYSDGTTRIWDLESASVLWELSPVRATRSALAANLSRMLFRRGWSPKFLADRSERLTENEVRLVLNAGDTGDWASVVAKLEQAFQRSNSEAPMPELRYAQISSISISPDDRQVMAVTPDSAAIRLWDLSQPGSDPLAFVIPKDVTGSGSRVDQAMFAPPSATTPAGADRLLTLGGNTVRLWDLHVANPADAAADRLTEVQRLGPHSAVTSVDVSPNGDWIVTGSWDGRAKIWNASTHSSVETIDCGQPINSVMFTSDAGRPQILASYGQFARLWDVRRDAEDPNQLRVAVAQTFGTDGDVRHEDRVRSAVAFERVLADKTTECLVVTAGDDANAFIWNAVSGQVVAELKGDSETDRHNQAVICVAASHDGKFLLTGSEDNTARLWVAESGAPAPGGSEGGTEPQPLVFQHTGPVTAVAFSPDGRRVVTGSQDKTVKIWDRATGRELITLRGHGDAITAVKFPRDWSGTGRHVLLTTSRDGTAIIWPAADWQSDETIPRRDQVATSH